MCKEYRGFSTDEFNAERVVAFKARLQGTNVQRSRTMFETAMFLEAFEKLCKVQHDRMKEQGFYDYGASADNTSIPTKILLFITEAAEMFEAYRKGKLTEPCDKDATILDPKATESWDYACQVCKASGRVVQPKLVSSPDCPPSEMQFITEEKPCYSCNGSKVVKVSGVRRLTNEEEELADIVIRIADYCGWRNIDLGRCILAKMQYNATRPYRHGKTC